MVPLINRFEEERKALHREIEHLRDRTAELELTRRTSEAKSASHQSRAAQLQDDLKLASLLDPNSTTRIIRLRSIYRFLFSLAFRVAASVNIQRSYASLAFSSK